MPFPRSGAPVILGPEHGRSGPFCFARCFTISYERKATPAKTASRRCAVRWSGMTHAQRMEWLLASSRTEVYCSSEGKAMFREAR